MTGHSFFWKDRTYTVTELLGKGKSAHSWLAQADGKRLVYKKMHQEEAEHYTFGNKLMAEVEAYQLLAAAKIRIPELYFWSDEEQYLVKEYIHGPTAAQLAAQGALDLPHWEAIFRCQNFLKDAGLHVDYFPTNFIWQDGEMILIDYECHPYNQEWDLPNWGIFYWLNTPGMAQHLKEGSSPLLNLPGRPKPVWEPFLSRRDQILSRLGQPALPGPETLWTC